MEDQTQKRLIGNENDGHAFASFNPKLIVQNVYDHANPVLYNYKFRFKNAHHARH
jgi:hypothetical protein